MVSTAISNGLSSALITLLPKTGGWLHGPNVTVRLCSGGVPKRVSDGCSWTRLLRWDKEKARGVNTGWQHFIRFGLVSWISPDLNQPCRERMMCFHHATEIKNRNISSQDTSLTLSIPLAEINLWHTNWNAIEKLHNKDYYPLLQWKSGVFLYCKNTHVYNYFKVQFTAVQNRLLWAKTNNVSVQPPAIYCNSQRKYLAYTHSFAQTCNLPSSACHDHKLPARLWREIRADQPWPFSDLKCGLLWYSAVRDGTGPATCFQCSVHAFV